MVQVWALGGLGLMAAACTAQPSTPLPLPVIREIHQGEVFELVLETGDGEKVDARAEARVTVGSIGTDATGMDVLRRRCVLVDQRLDVVDQVPQLVVGAGDGGHGRAVQPGLQPQPQVPSGAARPEHAGGEVPRHDDRVLPVPERAGREAVSHAGAAVTGRAPFGEQDAGPLERLRRDRRLRGDGLDDGDLCR